MNILRFIFFLFAFYIVFRAIKYFLKYLSLSRQNYNNLNRKKNSDSKYKDIEEAQFTEVESVRRGGEAENNPPKQK